MLVIQRSFLISAVTRIAASTPETCGILEQMHETSLMRAESIRVGGTSSGFVLPRDEGENCFNPPELRRLCRYT